MTIPPQHLLILSLILLAIGVVGVLVRRNVIIILMSIELILNAANINFVAFSRYWNNLAGQIFGVFNITVAAAEVAVGLAIVIAFFRNRETVNVDEMDLMKW
jgi:NADH-quinone oxidoreductase subunit K